MSHPVYYVPAGDVLPIFFASYDGATGASEAISGLAVTDIEIYKDGSTTQRASDAGYTLIDTDGIDVDGTVGINGFTIDTGDNTDAGFYTVGAWFTVVVASITADTQTVNFIAAQFRLMPAESVAGKPKVDTDTFGGTAGTFSSGRPEVNTTHAAGTAWGSGAITAASIASDAITDAKVASDVTIASVTGAVGSVTGNVGGNVAGSVGSVTATVNANVTQISGDSTAADNIEAAFDDTAGAVPWFLISHQGTLQSVTDTDTIVLAASASAEDDVYNGHTIHFVSGTTGVKQSRLISDYVGSSKTATLASAVTVALTGTITYKIAASAPAVSGGSGATAQEVWEYGTRELTALDEDNTTIDLNGTTIGTVTTVGTVNALANNSVTAAALAADAGTELGTAVWATATRTLTAGTNVDGSTFTAIPWNAAWDAEVQSEATDALNAYDPPTRAEATSDADSILTAVADLPTNAELSTALGTADDAVLAAISALDGKIDTIDNLIDTEMAAIKAKTDQLTFGVTNTVNANITYVNEIEVTGDGETGTEWGPA